MPDTPDKFYLTTPIYYVNARPHIGHAYSTIVADVLARRHRLLGDDTFFLTGTDEHGQKVQRSAEAAGIPPQQFTDEVSATFRGLWDRMGITYDGFIRTTDECHKRGVQKLWRVLEERGDIYLSSYTGQYCVSDEAFVDVPVGAPCPDCGRITETITEENYFFRLSAYQEKLIELIESGTLHIQPESVRNEVLSFVRGGLKDLSISRTTFDWGIPVPGNPKHVIYVWLDALANYITAIGYGSDDPAEQAKFERYWPADVHLVGKEITRFHCVYWPAFLMAAGLPVQKSVVANGWLLFEESKMSKSRGNVVRTETILDAFGEHYRASLIKAGQSEPDKRDCDLFAADVLRYFLLREIPFGQDGSFSFDALITRYNADLANGYGNLVSRTLSMMDKYLRGENRPYPGHENFQLIAAFTSRLEIAAIQMDGCGFSRALELINAAITAVDAEITLMAPWKTAASIDESETGQARYYQLAKLLHEWYESIRIITALLYAVMPHTTAKVWAQLGLGSIEEAARNGELKNLTWGGLKPGTKLGPLAPIFPRADKGLAQIMTDMENPTQSSAATMAESTTAPAAESGKPVESVPAEKSHAAGAESSANPPLAPQITIDDFAKVDLRVARVLVAERIPKADKLLRLEVDLGFEKRQILAGIAEYYAPETLIGRKVVIVANLAPRKMRGLESNGMIVAASVGPDGAPVLAGFAEDVELGARLK
jgi:methionyl-tRNA synthetase